MAQAKRSRSYHHGELREALIEAGRGLLEERGLAGFTLRECARRAGVSHAAPAHHFKSVNDLLAEIAARGFEALSAGMDAQARASPQNPAARLLAMGGGYIGFATANGAVFGLMFNREARAFRSERLARAGGEAYGRLVSAVEALIPAADPATQAAMADFAWASVHGMATLVLQGQLDRGGASARLLKRRQEIVLTAVVETIARTGRAR